MIEALYLVPKYNVNTRAYCYVSLINTICRCNVDSMTLNGISLNFLSNKLLKHSKEGISLGKSHYRAYKHKELNGMASLKEYNSQRNVLGELDSRKTHYYHEITIHIGIN